MGVRIMHKKHSWTHVAKWLTSVAWPTGCLFVGEPSPGVDWTQMMTYSLYSSCLIGEIWPLVSINLMVINNLSITYKVLWPWLQQNIVAPDH